MRIAIKSAHSDHQVALELSGFAEDQVSQANNLQIILFQLHFGQTGGRGARVRKT